MQWMRLQEDAFAVLQRLWDQTTEEFGVDDVHAMILSKTLNKEVIRQALIDLIVMGNLPFRIVEMKEFHVFCQSLNPQASDSITTTHSQVSRMIGESFQV
jgi:hypothetical protein